MAKTLRLQSKFPQTIYVRREDEGDESYLITFESPSDLDDGDTVAVYKFSETSKVTKTTTLS